MFSVQIVEKLFDRPYSNVRISRLVLAFLGQLL
jgi:hypothetical protein